MNTNIRIIKRSQREATNTTATGGKQKAAAAAAAARPASNRDSARHATRDITGHVATWIKEFQQKHTPDPRRAFASLFADPATSSID